MNPPAAPAWTPYCDQDYQPWDKLWCTEAQKRGYDSIQIFLPHGPGHETELVICTGCDQRPVRERTQRQTIETAFTCACLPKPFKPSSMTSNTQTKNL